MITISKNQKFIFSKMIQNYIKTILRTSQETQKIMVLRFLLDFGQKFHFEKESHQIFSRIATGNVFDIIEISIVGKWSGIT